MALLTDYYVDGDTGNDTTGDGTSGTPYATHQKAVDVIATESSNDLVTATTQVTIHLVAGNCGTGTLLSGITTNATYYTDTIGTTNTTLVGWDPGSPYVETNVTDDYAIRDELNYSQYHNFQILINNNQFANGLISTGINVTIDTGIVQGAASLTVNNLVGIILSGTSGTSYVRKVVVNGLGSSSSGYQRHFRNNGAATVYFQNCSAISDIATTVNMYGFQGSAGTVTCQNCYSNADFNYNSIETVTTSSSVSTDGDPASLDSIAVSTSYFVDPLNATPQSRDFSLVASTVFSNGTVATDLSGDYTTDWFDNTISTWEIATSSAPAVGGVVIPVIVNHLRNQGIS
jgi:hypothetical protein